MGSFFKQLRQFCQNLRHPTFQISTDGAELQDDDSTMVCPNEQRPDQAPLPAEEAPTPTCCGNMGGQPHATALNMTVPDAVRTTIKSILVDGGLQNGKGPLHKRPCMANQA